MTDTSQKRLWNEQDIVDVDTAMIPDRLYFKIGEVCEITGVKQHVLRYWESEFRILSPQRAKSKQRLYRRVDVETVLKIKKLLREQGFTISGAKRILARERQQRKRNAGRDAEADFPCFLKAVKADLEDIKKLLES